MARQKNIGVNATLNVIKSLLSVLFPVITYPYALRVLGAEGIGTVNYGSSIISYFALLAALGVSTYAVREGAQRKQDREAFNRFADEIFTINVVTTLIAYALLAAAMLTVAKLRDYRRLLILQSSTILLTTLGVDWINTVYEDFLLITVRSIVSHVITMALLFLFVHSPRDYYVYAALTVVNNGLVCVSNWFYVRRYAKVRLTRRPNFRRHIRPLLILFANAVTVTVYVNFDITMLGWMKGTYYTGLYTPPVKIYTIVKSLLAAVYTVAIPRLAFYRGNDRFADYRKLYSDLWGYLTLLLIPCGAGLICVAREAILFMGGEAFLESTLTLQILAVSLVFAIYGGLVTACLNITLHRERENLIATVLSALINCGLNLVFIPLLSHYGAAITTLISEAFVFLFCLIRVPNKGEYIERDRVARSIAHALTGSALIVGIALLTKAFIGSPVARVAVIVPASVLAYAGFLLLVRDEYAVENIGKLRSKLAARLRGR